MTAVPRYLLGRRAALAALCVGLVFIALLVVLPIMAIYASQQQEKSNSLYQLALFRAEAAMRPQLEAELQALRQRGSNTPGLITADSVSLAQAQLERDIKAIVETNGGEIHSAQIGASSRIGDLDIILIQYDLSIPVTRLSALVYAIESHYAILLHRPCRHRRTGGLAGGRQYTFRAKIGNPLDDPRLSMGRQMKIALTPWELALTGLCIVLGGAVLYECAAPLQAFNPPALELKKHQVAVNAAFFSPPSEASFSAIDTRPLFSPTRKPIDVPQGPGESGPGSAVPPLPSNVSLVGVIIDGDRQLALMKTQGAPFAESLRVGALIDGWKVTEIAPDKVVLHAGTAEQILGLAISAQTKPKQRDHLWSMARPIRRYRKAITRPPLKQSIPSNGSGPANRQQFTMTIYRGGVMRRYEKRLGRIAVRHRLVVSCFGVLFFIFDRTKAGRGEGQPASICACPIAKGNRHDHRFHRRRLPANRLRHPLKSFPEPARLSVVPCRIRARRRQGMARGASH